MAQYSTPATLSGLYKEAYADGIANLIPNKAVLMKAMGELGETEKEGNLYHQPVIVAIEQGFTYGGAAATAGAYTLQGAIAMTMQDAKLEGSESTLTSQIGLGALSKAANGGAKSFKKAFGLVLEANLTSHAIRKEMELLYGQSATGIAATASSVNIDADSTTVQFSTAGWAPGVFSGMEGTLVEFFRSDTNAKLGGGAFTLTSVDIDLKKAVVTRTGSGAALDTGIAATTCYMDFAGARGAAFTNKVAAPGLDFAVTLAAGNTLWNVSTNYSLWRGNSYATGGALTFGKVLSGVNKAVGRAGLDEDIDLYCAVDTWPSLADSFSASRVLDSSYSESEGKNGVRKLTYIGVNGKISVTGHPCVKSGEAFGAPLKRCKKVGSSDITTQVPGRGDELFVLVSGVNAVEFRTYSDFCFFTEAPAKLIKWTGIVNP